MNILITGGTGFLGRALVDALQAAGHQITLISRNPSQAQSPGVQAQRLDELRPAQCFEVVINLAGSGIADQRWSDARKQELLHSRVHTTAALVDWMRQTPVRPQLLLSGSAIGWYGAQGDTELTEHSPAHAEFVHELCEHWEHTARQAEALGVRTVLLRTGIVLDPGGGALKKMLLPFLIGLGGRIGDGQQWMSWISRDDWVGAVLFLLRAELQGPVNLTAPQPVRNQQFARLLAQALHRPALFPLPAWLLRLMMGEMSGLLLDSQRVLPGQLQAAGFAFRHPDLATALAHLLRK